MFERILVNFGIPFFVCVFVPVMVVWLVSRTKQHETDLKAEVMLKALEAGVPVNMNQFESPKKAPKPLKQALLEKLTTACILTLMGPSFLALGIIRQFNPDFAAGMFFSEWLIPAGAVMLAVGIGMLVSYFAGKKMLARELEAEEKAQGQSGE